LKKYIVTLTAEERQDLHDLIASGKGAAKKLAHARILLKADASPGGPAWADGPIAQAVEVSIATLERARLRFVEQGLEAALVRKPQDRPSRELTLDGRAEAHLIALACSPPPEGRAVWTMRLLADELIELEVVTSVSDETVRRTLKETRSSPGWSSDGACRRRPTPSSSAPWRTCSTSSTAPSTRIVR
jgi:transposase